MSKKWEAVQTHGEIGARFLQNRPEVARARPQPAASQQTRIRHLFTCTEASSTVHIEAQKLHLLTAAAREAAQRVGHGERVHSDAAVRAATVNTATAMPRRATFVQLDTSLNLQGRHPGSSSRKRAIHLHRLDSAILLGTPHFDDHIGGQAAPYAPDPHTRLAASPSTDIANLRGWKTLAMSMGSNKSTC